MQVRWIFYRTLMVSSVIYNWSITIYRLWNIHTEKALFTRISRTAIWWSKLMKKSKWLQTMKQYLMYSYNHARDWNNWNTHTHTHTHTHTNKQKKVVPLLGKREERQKEGGRERLCVCVLCVCAHMCACVCICVQSNDPFHSHVVFVGVIHNVLDSNPKGSSHWLGTCWLLLAGYKVHNSTCYQRFDQSVIQVV